MNYSALSTFEKLATGGWWKKIWLLIVESCVNVSSTEAGDRIEPVLFNASRRDDYGKAVNTRQFKTCQTLEYYLHIPPRLISIAVLKNFIDVRGEINVNIDTVKSKSRLALIELVLLFVSCTLFFTVLWSLLVSVSTFFQLILQVTLLGILSLVGIAFWLLASYQVFVYGIVPLTLLNELEENRFKFLGVGICYQTIDTES